MKTGKGLLEYLEEENLLPAFYSGETNTMRMWILFARINRETDPYLLNILNKIVDTTDVDMINLLETEYTNYKNRKI